MAISEVKVTAKGLKRRKKIYKITKIMVIVLFIVLFALFFVLMVIYKGGHFTVTLDPDATLKNGIIMYDSKELKTPQYKLYAKEIEFMDNISGNWIPKNINDQKDGSHNGENYIAYTFYIENIGKTVTNYWYQVNILDTIKNVDEAIRIKIYQNGKPTIYAKKNDLTKKPEENTTPFKSKSIAVLKQRKHIKPKEVDKYTIVIYLEGDDPDCIDALIGGEIKLNMEFREEHVEEDGTEKN